MIEIIDIKTLDEAEERIDNLLLELLDLDFGELNEKVDILSERLKKRYEAQQ